MLQTHTYTMSLRESVVCTIGIVIEIFIFKESSLGCLLNDILVRTVVQVISGKVHIAVKKRESTIHTTHPGS